jgi:hypothetical protein
VSCATHRLDGGHIVTITVSDKNGKVLKDWPE